MAEDLRQQASEMYRQRDDLEKMRTSEGLSVKKTVYVSFVILAVVLVLVQIFGGFSRRTDPVVAATAPPPLVKEAPPAELLQETNASKPELAQSDAVQPAASVAPTPITAERTAPQPPAQPAASVASAPITAERTVPQPPPVARAAGQAKPALKREAPSDPAARPAARRPPAGQSAEAQSSSTPAPPGISDVERTRREMAREIVLEKNAQLGALVATPESRGWEAEPLGPEDYTVTFTVLDKATGTAVRYVWKVNLTARTAAPLSYYARKLS